MKENKLVELSMDFSVDIINLVKYLKANHETIISNQIGRSGTSIGTNIHEAQYAQGTKDFISKFEIALKEANETGYWLELLYRTNILTSRLSRRYPLNAPRCELCSSLLVKPQRRTQNEKSKYSTTHSLHLLIDWQYNKFVESIDQDSICTLCLYRPSSLNIGDLVWCCHCQTDKEQKEIILISIIRHLLFVFTSIQTPFIRF